MPIANCFVISGCQPGSSNLVELWASESGQSPEHMTVNIVEGTKQLGNIYPVMAILLLPSIWSEADTSSLQLGLATALAIHFNLASSEVHVVTQIVNSGLVVEDGEEIQW